MIAVPVTGTVMFPETQMPSSGTAPPGFSLFTFLKAIWPKPHSTQTSRAKDALDPPMTSDSTSPSVLNVFLRSMARVPLDVADAGSDPHDRGLARRRFASGAFDRSEQCTVRVPRPQASAVNEG